MTSRGSREITARQRREENLRLFFPFVAQNSPKSAQTLPREENLWQYFPFVAIACLMLGQGGAETANESITGGTRPGPLPLPGNSARSNSQVRASR